MSAATRHQTIERLRRLLGQCDDPKCSLCRVMARRGLFCRGFAAWDEAELRERFHWFCGVRQGVARQEIEDLADRWQLVDQVSRGLAVPCDLAAVAPPERLGCEGWERFGDEALEAFAEELEQALGEPRDQAG